MKIVYTGRADQRLFKEALGQTIGRLLEEDPDVLYLDADLMSCIGTAKLPGKTPRASTAALPRPIWWASPAARPRWASSPSSTPSAPSPPGAASTRVFLSGGYAGNPITVIGSDPGITAAFNGGTHMPFEDMALYRTIPGSVVVDATDVPMLTAFLEMAKDLPGVKYVRVGRKGSCQVYEDGAKFEIGKGQVLREGGDAVIIACGIMVHEAMQAAAQLAREGIEEAVGVLVGAALPGMVRQREVEDRAGRLLDPREVGELLAPAQRRHAALGPPLRCRRLPLWRRRALMPRLARSSSGESSLPSLTAR